MAKLVNRLPIGFSRSRPLMAKTLARSRLHVEGPDDQHSLVHLLIRNGVNFHPERVELYPIELPQLYPMNGVEQLLDGMETAIEASTGRTIGFVLDADSPLIGRWQNIVHRLKAVGMQNLPEMPPPAGYVDESKEFKTKIGVWLMPDNTRDGKLEDFLLTLIDENDPLIGHAQAATDEARIKGAGFSNPDTIKAVIHSWLAWQDKPGSPYGIAMSSKYFKHDSPAAALFVQWFKTLYEIG